MEQLFDILRELINNGFGIWGIIMFVQMRRYKKAELTRDTVAVYQKIAESNNETLLQQNEKIILLEERVSRFMAVITRMEGRTPVPAKEKVAAFASHNATMVLFLSTGLLEKLEGQLIEGGYKEDTPAAIVYKATWPEEESYICTVSTLAETAKAHGITKTALIIVGDVVTHHAYERSKLYDPEFTTEFRQGVK